MTQTLGNLGSGWASSAPFRTGSSCHQRRKGPPIYKPRHCYGPKAENEPPRKQLKQQHHWGHWFQQPQSPYWAMYSHWGCWGGPWCPPPMGYQKPPGPVQVTRMYGLHPVCLCCCSCCHGPWNPGWVRPPGKKKRWGRRGGGLRRHPRRPFKKSPPVDGSKLPRPVNLYEWQVPDMQVPDMRVPGLQAPRNTTQFIMNQIYEDMRQQEELERQQEALRAQQAQEGKNDAPPSGGEEDTELPDILYGFGQNPLAFTPDPVEENQFPAPQRVEEEKNDEHDEECDGKEEESEEEDEEAETQDEEEVEEADYKEDEEKEEEEEEEESEKIEEGEENEAEEIEEEGLEEDKQAEEENHLTLDMPLSFLLGDEEERELYKLFVFKPETNNS